MDWNWSAISIIGGISTLVVLTIIVITFALQGWISLPIASLVVTAIGAFGTIILAGATYLSIRQNQITIEELRKDRQQPVVLDVLREVIHPNLERANNSVRRMRSGQIPFDPGNGVRSRVRPVSAKDVDLTTLEQITDEYPDLIDKLNDWSQLFRAFDEAVIEADEEVSRMLEKELTTDDPTSDHVKNTLIACVKSRSLSDERHRELREMLWTDCESVMVEVRRNQYNLLQHLERVEDDLVELEQELKQNYGISSIEIESD